jgi:hypothetical protein
MIKSLNRVLAIKRTGTRREKLVCHANVLLDPAEFELEVDNIAFEALNALQLLCFHTAELVAYGS